MLYRLNEQYKFTLDEFRKFRDIATADIVAEDIDDFLKQKKADGQSRYTITKKFAALKSCLYVEAEACDWVAARSLLIATIRGMPVGQVKSDPLHPHVHLEPICALCLDNLTGHRDEAIFRVASAWAMGRGAADILCDEIEECETGLRYRNNIIPTGKKAFFALRRVMADRGIRAGDHAPLFVNIRKGQRPSERLTDQSINDLTKKYAERAGFQGRFTAHSWSIGSITFMVERGVTPDRIMRWTGMSSRAIAEIVRPSEDATRPQDLIA